MQISQVSELQAMVQGKAFISWWLHVTDYSYVLSVCKKYGHFSFLCKEMDIFLGKVYIVRKSCLSRNIFGLIQYLSHVASSKNRF